MKEERAYHERLLFSHIFGVAHGLQRRGDTQLKGTGMTTRQWYLMASAQAFAEQEGRAPSIGECARFMGSSHQNVRQLTTRLAEKGFIRLRQDEGDQRVSRIELTEGGLSFWKEREERDARFLRDLFGILSDQEAEQTARGLQKLFFEWQRED